MRTLMAECDGVRLYCDGKYCYAAFGSADCRLDKLMVTLEKFLSTYNGHGLHKDDVPSLSVANALCHAGYLKKQGSLFLVRDAARLRMLSDVVYHCKLQ